MRTLEIRKVLIEEGFLWMQGSVYFGSERIDAVTCVLAAQRLARELAWFAGAVRDIRIGSRRTTISAQPSTWPAPSAETVPRRRLRRVNVKRRGGRRCRYGGGAGFAVSINSAAAKSSMMRSTSPPTSGPAVPNAAPSE
jgi:hypothetical protein